MTRKSLLGRHALAAALAGAMIAHPVLADKPPWAGGGKKHDENEQRESHDGKDRDRDHERSEARGRRHFEDRHKVVVRDYYVKEFHGGHCPPGLAKKHNGCMPPGQARKWAVGRPLPREVVYYELPPTLIVKIGAPPPGYRYVRVASDILMIAVGTSLVVDAINDLGRR